MELDDSKDFIKTLELMNKNVVFHTNLIRPIAELLVPANKRQFRLLDDPDSDNWNDYIMNAAKFTKNDDVSF